MTRANVPATILTFIAGLAVGAVAALLLAPKSGEELRDDIAEGVGDRVDQVRNKAKNLKQRAQKVVDIATDQVQSAIEAGDTAYHQAKKA
jgi:gas vesicle protein